jgi:hypothetical protein
LERIGLIAGNGTFPLLFAREARARGVEVVAVAHRGETLAEIDDALDSVTWIRVGQVGRMVRALKKAGVTRAVMCGGIDKATRLSDLRPDWRGVRLLGRVRRSGASGDDAILRGLADELSAAGIEVVPSTTFLERIVISLGLIAGPAVDDRARSDIALGWRVLAAIGDMDVGQGVVVEDGVVLAIEAIEGTDAAIRRAAELGRGGAVVVKAAKSGQDMRFDVPAIGPRTIETMAQCGARVLAVEAGATIVLDDETVRQLAERHGISLVGCDTAGVVPDV